MVGTVLLIQRTKNFLMSAIESNLEKEDVKTHAAPFDIKEIKMYVESVDAIFVSLDDEISSHTDVFIYLKDIIQDYSKELYVMGEPVNIAEATKVLGEENISMTFVRPVNAKDVSIKILSKLDNEERHNRINFKSVLVVDDSGTFLHTIKNWLSPYYNVTVVNSATMALTYLGKNKTDLILLDYEMPVCSGPRMLEMLRADDVFKDIPVMFLTGKGDRESIKAVLALKPQGYLLKTLPKEKILENVAAFFEKQQTIG